MDVTVSVVVPTINRGETLLRTLAGLRKCDEFFEVVVVDQTAKHTENVARELSEMEGQQVRILRQQEASAAKARNAGLAAARGDVVLFIDDDVEFDNSLIRMHGEAYVAGVDYVCGQIRPPNGAQRLTTHPLADWAEAGWLFFPLNFAERRRLVGGGSGNLSVRREAAIAVGGMDERYARGAHREESDFCLRLRDAGYAGVFEPRAWVKTLAEPNGGIRSWNVGKLPSMNHVVGEWYFAWKHGKLESWPAYAVVAVARQILQPSMRAPHLMPLATMRSLAGFAFAGAMALRPPRVGMVGNEVKSAAKRQTKSG